MRVPENEYVNRLPGQEPLQVRWRPFNSGTDMAHQKADAADFLLDLSGQAGRFTKLVNVATNSRQRCDLLQALQNAERTDVAGMQDRRRPCKILGNLRTPQSMRVREDSDFQRPVSKRFRMSGIKQPGASPTIRDGDLDYLSRETMKSGI